MIEAFKFALETGGVKGDPKMLEEPRHSQKTRYRKIRLKSCLYLHAATGKMQAHIMQPHIFDSPDTKSRSPNARTEIDSKPCRPPHC